jgi:hypothetical protein
LPKRKHRLDSRAGETLLTVLANIAKKQIAEGDAINALGDRTMHCFAHQGVVCVVRAG